MEFIAGPPAWLEWDGQRWYRSRKGYYQNRAGVQLQTVVWERVHDCRVPDGQVVHHRDEDPANNQPDNLQLLTRREHLEAHGQLGRPQPPEVRQAISEAQKASWAKRKPRTRVCANCGEDFQSTGQRAKFCGEQCRTAAYREQHRASR